jgi:hypothetical protein
VLLALPVTTGAQQRRSDDRRADNQQSNRNQSDQRRSDDRRSDDRRTPAATQLPWWERQQTPWWERQQTPAWELKQIPGWEQGNVARALLDQQRYQQQPNTGNHRRPRHYQPSVVYVLPPYGYYPNSLATTAQFVGASPPPTAPFASEPQQPPPMGALRLEVEPKESLQIFVDGVYVGTPADLGDELELLPGTRRIELRARGYRTLVFSAEITDGRLITYRGALERFEVERPAAPVVPAAVAPAAPVGSTTMYVIPGCYLGNVSPKTVVLPAGCDISKLTTISP